MVDHDRVLGRYRVVGRSDLEGMTGDRFPYQHVVDCGFFIRNRDGEEFTFSSGIEELKAIVGRDEIVSEVLFPTIKSGGFALYEGRERIVDRADPTRIKEYYPLSNDDMLQMIAIANGSKKSIKVRTC